MSLSGVRKSVGAFFRRKCVRNLLLCAGIAGLLAAAFFCYTNWSVKRCEARVFSRLEDLPANEYGLLLGTSKFLYNTKYPNLYFARRIAAAAMLYHAGKIRKIIVSGDNRFAHYNEPEDMRQSLLELGVKDADILPDYAGRHTLDSVVRAKTVFHAEKLTVISQSFHCARAIFIADHHGIEAVGFAAAEVYSSFRRRMQMREMCSRVLAWCDVRLWYRMPRYPL